MSAVERLAGKAVDNLKGLDGGREAAFDPAVFLGFAEIILQLIAKIQECRGTPAEGIKVINNPTLLQRAAVGLQVRKFLGDGKTFRKHGQAMKDALLKTGAETTVEDLTEAWEEV